MLTQKLNDLVGKTVLLETKEGFVRKALVTELRCDHMEINGVACKLPIEIVLSEDDPLPVSQIRSIKALE